MNDEPEIMDGDDLVRQTDFLIQQLAAARASSGVPTPPARSGGGGGGANVERRHQHEGYSVPSEVTFGLPADGGEAAEDGSAGKNDGTLSTADVTGRTTDDSSSDGDYQDAVQGSSDGDLQPGPQDLDCLAQAKTHAQPPAAPTPLRAKIMEKYGREGSTSDVFSGSSQQQIPSSVTSSKDKKKKNKGDKNKRKDGSSSRKKKTSGSRKSASPGSDAHEIDGSIAASAAYSQPQRQQQQHGYGADYTPSMPTSPPPVPARTSTRALQSAMPAASQIYAGGYQGTPNESLQEAMKQAEIAEDAARRMREAVSVHQTMDRDGSAGGMSGFGSSDPGRYGPSPNPEPARVGTSYLERGATACIRELLSCLADPLAALAGDNAAPAGSSVTGFGGMEDPHPRWARVSGNYEYVPVPNIGHAFGGGDAPAATGEGSATNSSENERSKEYSERKGLLSGTGYDSNW